jgi:hypothetical protein
MASTATDVTKMIAEIAGVPVPDSSAALSALGFNDDMCSDLAEELDSYVKRIKPGSGVNDAEITSDQTVQNIIDLVNQKIEA